MPKILIIRFSSIGDIVLTSPVIRCVKEQVPDAEVHFLTKKSFAGIFEANPYVDRLFLLEDSLAKVLQELKKECYDYVLDLHNNLRSKRVKLALGCPSKAFDKLNFEKWLLVNMRINRMPERHIVDRYLDTAASLGVKNDEKGLEYFIPESTKMPELPYGGEYICIAIGAQHATKRMPREKIAEVCSLLQKPVVLLGGKEDIETGDWIAASGGPQVWNAAGKLSLHQSALVVKNSTYLITHDTGMMHIGAALHKPIVSIWGNTVPEFGMYPYYPADFDNRRSRMLEVKGLSCRPCSKIGYQKCPKGHFKCMMEISAKDVVRDF